MPDNGVQTAQALVDSAEDLVQGAERLVQGAERLVLSTSRKEAFWQLLAFVLDKIVASVTLYYILISCSGAIYSLAFYSQLGSFHIFDFFGTSDFLLSAFQNVTMLLINVWAIVVVAFTFFLGFLSRSLRGQASLLVAVIL